MIFADRPETMQRRSAPGCPVEAAGRGARFFGIFSGMNSRYRAWLSGKPAPAPRRLAELDFVLTLFAGTIGYDAVDACAQSVRTLGSCADSVYPTRPRYRKSRCMAVRPNLYSSVRYMTERGLPAGFLKHLLKR